MADNVKGRHWRQLFGFGEVLRYSQKPLSGESFATSDLPAELANSSSSRYDRYSLDGEQQEFADGTALVILTGLRLGSGCPTCGDGDSSATFYYALEAPNA